MPYADPDQQREFNRELFNRRYNSDPEFREAEAFRKARWYQTHRERILSRVRERQKSSGRQAPFELGEAAYVLML